MEPLHIPANLDFLDNVGHYVLKVAEQAGLPKKKAYRLRLAVDELATNIINYGYANVPTDAGLVINAILEPTQLKIILEDSGLAYDPRQREFDESILSKPIEERPIGGLGIFLALKNVDEFTYQALENRNISCFVVKLESD